MSRLPRFITKASRTAFFVTIGALAGVPAESQFSCPDVAGPLAEATAVMGSSGTCYRFQVPAESPFVRLQVTASGAPLDLYFSPGIQEALTDLDRVNPNPVEGDAKFVLLEPDAGDYTVAVAPQAPTASFNLQATAAALPGGGGPLTVCDGDGICSITMPMTRAAQAVELGSAFGDRVVFPVTVNGPGTIRIDASWTGSAERLALILNGPDRPEMSNPVAYYAREDGSTPLTLSYSITQEDAQRGQRFFVSLVNFSGGEAQGDVKITKPRLFRLNLMSRLAMATGIRLLPPIQAVVAVCAGQVQDRIAWDYQGSTHWAESNVDRLCQGAVTSEEPAICFQRVMHDGIDWGGGSRWQWENAIDLCEGTNDAAGTIACFQGRIRAGDPWQQAIRACETR